MDDLYSNAWSRPDEDIANKAAGTSDTSWKLSPASAKSEEADVGLPSWSTGDIKWTEPTGQGSLWTSEVAADDLSLDTRGNGWSSETGLDYGISGTRNREEEEQGEEEPEEEEEELGPEHKEENATSAHSPHGGPVYNEKLGSTPVAEAQELSSEQRVELEVPSVNDVGLKSSDLFGSFETGLEPGLGASSAGTDSFGRDDSWGSSVVPLDADEDKDAWGSSWRDSSANDKQEEGPKDEWELAREQKLLRERAVPPELIASVLDRLNELSPELWPETPKTEGDAADLGNWRDGMDNVAGLKDLVEKALPGVVTQPPIQFARSHTAKAMATSVKLSKNLPVARQSPMAHLFAANSSAAWELSLKNKIETPKDDVPAGWRTVEPEEQKEQKPQPVEKKTGGFLSFLSRRSSTVPTSSFPIASQPGERSASPTPSRASASGTKSTRASVDVQPIVEKIQLSMSLSSLASDMPAPAMASSASLPSSLSSPPSSSNVATSTQSQEPSARPSSPADSTAPSVVSRFFNRFSRASRTDSQRSSSSTRSSIALSTDDIEFLSEIVPSHSDDMDENDQLSALTALVSSPAASSLPSKLPPPLAPPPRSTSTMLTSPTRSQPNSSRPSSILGDLDTFTSPKIHSLSITLPPPLPPPISPTSFTSLTSLSKPSTPSPLGNGHSRSASKSSIPGIASPPSRIRTPISLSFAGQGIIQANVIESSPVQQPLSLPPILPSAPLESQAASSQQISMPSAGLISPIAPPPLEKSPGRVYAQTNTKTVFDDDDFSDYASSPSTPQAIPTLGSAVSASGVSSSDKSMLLSQRNEDDFGDFGDFGDFISTAVPSSSLSSALPPPITSGPQTATVPPPPPKKHVPANIKTHVRKPSAADHQAAVDLVEKAAAWKGRWPAPPSPIAERLPPPPPPSIASRSISPPVSSITLMPIAQITSISRSSTPPIGVPSNATSVPGLLPPHTISGRPPSSIPFLLDLDTPSNSISPPPASISALQDFTKPEKSPPKPAASSAQGGLSAQDLLFFEGL